MERETSDGKLARARRLLGVAQLASIGVLVVVGLDRSPGGDWLSPVTRTAVGAWVLNAAIVLAALFVVERLARWALGTVRRLSPAGRVRAKERAAELAAQREATEVGRPVPGAIEVAPPVVGRWQAANSPADKVPSHGTEWGGQSHAIDIIKAPEGVAGPGGSLWRLRAPGDFPAFGSPILAPGPATVVSVLDQRRDHRARTSLLGFVYFLFEQVARSLAPHSFTFGNHVVLRLDDGVTYAAYCHLKRHSISVSAGDRVTEGQTIGRCGNSGNSTEPHLHFQLMDSTDVDTARGIPFTWRGVGVPGGGEKFTVGDVSAVIMRE